MNAFFQRFFQRHAMWGNMAGAAIMGAVTELIDEKYMQRHCRQIEDQIDVELLEEEGQTQVANQNIPNRNKHSQQMSRKRQQQKDEEDPENSFWGSYMESKKSKTTIRNMLEAATASAFIFGPAATFWYPFLHRLTLSRMLVGKSVNLKVAFMTLLDMLPFAGATLFDLLLVSKGFEFLEKQKVIRFPDSLKRKLKEGMEKSEHDEEHVVEIELSEILDLKRMKDDESIRELSTELVVDMGMATPQPSWIIVPLLAACNFRFIPVVYRGIFAMASAVAYRIPAHMVLENENALNHFVLHALELKGMEEADE